MSRFVVVLGCLSLLALMLMTISSGLAPSFGLAAVLLGVAGIAAHIYIRRSSRYDLGLLRELHESGGPPPEDDLPEIPDDAGVICTCCGRPYAAWLLICPNCKR